MKQLIIQLARLGDIMQTARLVASAEQHGETCLCVDCSLVEAAQAAYPAIKIYGIAAHGDDATDMFVHNSRIFDELRAEKFDTVYNLNHSGLNRALAGLFAPEQVCGYRLYKGQPERDTWLRMAMRWTGTRALSPLNLVDLWGLMAKKPIAPEKVNPKPNARGGGIGVAVAGRNARRSLPPAVLAKALTALFQRYDGPRIVLLGSAAERPAARALRDALPSTVLAQLDNRVGRTSLIDLFKIINDLDMLLSPDTGLMHIAARLGVPVEGFFLSSAWAFETGPYGQGHRIWQAAPLCAPCAESTPCSNPQACHAPFASDAWLRALLYGSSAPDLHCLTSGFDALGLIWDGLASPKRNATRRVLAAYCGVGLPAISGTEEVAAAAQLFAEADWMLSYTDPLLEDYQ